MSATKTNYCILQFKVGNQDHSFSASVTVSGIKGDSFYLKYSLTSFRYKGNGITFFHTLENKCHGFNPDPFKKKVTIIEALDFSAPRNFHFFPNGREMTGK